MYRDKLKSNVLSMKIGFWAALLFTLAGIGYSAGLGAAAVLFPAPLWTDIHAYADYIRSTPGRLYTLCQAAAFAAAPLFVLLLCSVHDIVQDEKKILTRIGLCFGTVFAVLTGMSYFVQFTVIPQSIAGADPDGLNQFVGLNTRSFISAMSVLGYGLFLGLAALFTAPVFSGGGLEKAIRLFLLLCGISCILETVGFIAQNILLAMAFTAAMSIFLTASSILICILFRKMIKLHRR